MERHSDIAWPVIGKIGHDHREHAINLESDVRHLHILSPWQIPEWLTDDAGRDKPL